jgi:N-dimethylarginine dimethylaminohydrolase
MTLINSSVLMSDARHFSTAQAINPYYGTASPLLEKVIEEHTLIGRQLEAAGVAVIRVDSPINSQDGVYTANWALIRGNKAILARLPEARKAEENHARNVLTGLGKEVVEVPDQLRFSGQGDALPFGEYLFCGKGYRSDEAAQKFAADQLGYTRIQLETVPERDLKDHAVINSVSGWPDSSFYDIDLALAILRPPEGEKKGLIAYCPEAFTPESQATLEAFPYAEKIIISLDEAMNGFAANLISTSKTVIMSGAAPKLAAELKQRGFNVVTPAITELVKGGGYIRCTTLSFNA